MQLQHTTWHQCAVVIHAYTYIYSTFSYDEVIIQVIAFKLGIWQVYLYGWLLPFAGGRFTTPVMKNAKISVFKFPRNFAQPFLFIPAHSYGTHSSQVKLSGTNASFGAIEFFRCYSHFCTTAKQSALTLCQAFCAMQQPTPPHPTMISVARQTHRRSIKDVYMCKERHAPHPTPPHHDLRSTKDTQT